MGSNKSKDKHALDFELPQHTLTLPEYFIGKYPVTNAQWRAFYQARSRSFEVPQGKSEHPVIQISWHDAIAFCDWLSKKSGWKIALPTEAEWEKAARGKNGRIYPWGNVPPTKNLLNFNCNVNDTTPVGQYSPKGDSPYSCADMAGNVWEWTRSLWGKDVNTPEFKYPYVVSDGYEDLKASDDIRRVVRGGSWNNNSHVVRAAIRDWGRASLPGYHLGFRVVLSALV